MIDRGWRGSMVLSRAPLFAGPDETALEDVLSYGRPWPRSAARRHTGREQVDETMAPLLDKRPQNLQSSHAENKRVSHQAVTAPREDVQITPNWLQTHSIPRPLTETNLPVVRSAAVHGADDGTQGSRHTAKRTTQKNFVRWRAAGL